MSGRVSELLVHAHDRHRAGEISDVVLTGDSISAYMESGAMQEVFEAMDIVSKRAKVKA